MQTQVKKERRSKFLERLRSLFKREEKLIEPLAFARLYGGHLQMSCDKEILALLEEAGIEHKGLFLNADAGFDSKSLRDFLESKEIIANIKPNPRNGEQPDVYFDKELYKNRFKIEQANGWIDGYKSLIMRYEYLDVTWIGILLLGFISKFLKKV